MGAMSELHRQNAESEERIREGASAMYDALRGAVLHLDFLAQCSQRLGTDVLSDHINRVRTTCEAGLRAAGYFE